MKAPSLRVRLLRTHVPLISGILVCIVATSAATSAYPWAAAVFVDSLSHRDENRVIASSITMIGLIVAGALTWLLCGHMTSRAVETVARELRVDTYKSLLGSNLEHVIGRDPAHVRNVIDNDVGTVASIWSTAMLPGITGTVTILFATCNMLILDWRLAVLALLLFAVWLAFFLTSTKAISSVYADAARARDVFSSIVAKQAMPGGLTYSATFRSAAEDHSRFRQAADRLRDVNLQSQKRSSLQNFGASVFSAAAAAALIFAGAILIWHGDATVGIMVGFLTYQQMLQSPVASIISIRSQIGALSVSEQRLSTLLSLPQRSTGTLSTQGQILEARGLSVGYLDGGPVIHGINLRIRRGEKVAIVGRSGSGKSTLLLAIQGVLSAIEGEITVDGIPLENLSDDCVRSMMAYSAQNLPFIEQIVGDAMDLRGESGFVARRILETAAIDLESTIGISATGYSSGEEQRMSLARAIARDAGFVFLDEPTSFLDPSNEAIIFEILRGLKAAVICATHSLRQADLFDRVIVMADGRIVEEGVPADLRCSEGAYSALLGDERNVQVEGLMGNA